MVSYSTDQLCYAAYSQSKKPNQIKNKGKTFPTPTLSNKFVN